MLVCVAVRMTHYIIYSTLDEILLYAFVKNAKALCRDDKQSSVHLCWFPFLLLYAICFGRYNVFVCAERP